MQMDTLPIASFNFDEGKLFSGSDTLSTSSISLQQDSVAGGSRGGGAERALSPSAPPFQSQMETDLMALMQEPRLADTAPSTSELDEVLLRLQRGAADEGPGRAVRGYYTGTHSSEGAGHSGASQSWSSVVPAAKAEVVESFDFLIKCLSSANNYVSMLTREQYALLRAMRPTLLYEVLTEVARARSDRRLRRPLANECAFCKNNGENEECYGSHVLKDSRGRVLCPVLRAFRCPRCGATGDRAHTIKYCPEAADAGLERSCRLGSARRRGSVSSLPRTPSHGASHPAYAAQASQASQATPMQHSASSVWSNFGYN